MVPVLVNMETFEAGKEVPWILLRLNLVPVTGYPPAFQPVAERVHQIAKAEFNATA